MTIKSAMLGAAACLLVATVAFGQAGEEAELAGNAPTPMPSVAGEETLGVSFTSGQATAGKSVYDRNCSSCHGGSLEGTNDAPALSGDFFLSYWTGRSAADLYNYMHDFMPPAAPSSLQESQYADIAAYVLSRNGFEPGETALSADGDLEAMIIGE